MPLGWDKADEGCPVANKNIESPVTFEFPINNQ